MRRRDLLISTLAAAPAAAVSVGTIADAATPSRATRKSPKATLYVRDWGQGRPIVFLSAWGFWSEAWQYQMIPLHQQGFRCVAYDRRGHGRSNDPGGGYDYDTLADDLAQVLEQLDLRDVVLVAYSMGSGEAVRYLTRHGGSRISKVVFLAPITPFLSRTADNPDGIDPAVFARSRAAISRDFPAALAAGFGTFIDKGCSEELKSWAKSIMLQCSLKALIDCQAAFTGTDFRAELKRVSLPTLVIQGDADRSALPSLTGERTAALLSNCRKTVYAGAPHGLVFTETERLNADIAAFAEA